MYLIHIQTTLFPASGTYELDNFKPYITDVNIRYNNELLYQAVRAGNEGSSDPDDGFVMNRIHEYPISPGQLLPNTLTVEVTTSEPMQNVRMSYKKAGGITVFPNPVAMTKDITDNLRWTGSIATFNPGDCYDVQFKGQDLSGNEVINVSLLLISTRDNLSNAANQPYSLSVLPNIVPSLSWSFFKSSFNSSIIFES